MLEHGGALLWVCLPILVAMLFNLAWFFRRRDLHPIRERHPILSLFGNSVLCLKFLMTPLLHTIQSSHCVFLALDTLFLTGVSACVFTYRAILLYLRYNILLAQNALKDADDSPSDITRFSTKHHGKRKDDKLLEDYDFAALLDSMTPSSSQVQSIYRLKRLTRPFAIAMAVSWFVALFGISLIVASVIDDFNIDTNPTCTLDTTKLITLVWTLVLAILAGIVSLKIREVSDSTHIKRELASVAQIILVGLVVWFSITAISALEEINENSFPLSATWLMLVYCAVYWCSIIMPIRESQRAQLRGAEEEASPTSDFKTSNMDMGAVLANEVGYEGFKAFLQKEFSVENLMFYGDVKQFQRQFSHVDTGDNVNDVDRIKLCAAAMKIFKTYIDQSSPLEVNLPSALARDLRLKMGTIMMFKGPELNVIEPTSVYDDRPFNNIEDVKSSLFNEALLEIYALMEKDSFPRFRRSPEFEAVAGQMAGGAQV